MIVYFAPSGTTDPYAKRKLLVRFKQVPNIFGCGSFFKALEGKKIEYQ